MSILTTVSTRRPLHRPRPARSSRRARNAHDGPSFTPLIDAKAASGLLGVPYTWLLAQARAGQVPHHRLGHYVRFDPDDLRAWLHETKHMPVASRHHGGAPSGGAAAPERRRSGWPCRDLGLAVGESD